MLDDSESLKLAVDVNRALRSGDANGIITSVTKFMERNGLRADIELVQKIPNTAQSS